ncbi:hypothetical protein CK203_095680 [Vitis vinifera]|uniref:EDR1/CTR1/ARMC3-like peptidase-like domain-containing protein n=1 Tax=Vitis vinifera TaxID=29760 RepID=A0A438F0A2_VITVI|nr:hypothetical protein CK203_095680 [Vitis vinifera]
MQKLADCIGLPCRIAQGCKYCVANHRSSCLVKIDDMQSSRLKKNDICCYLHVPRLANNPLIVLAIKIACYCRLFLWLYEAFH